MWEQSTTFRRRAERHRAAAALKARVATLSTALAAWHGVTAGMAAMAAVRQAQQQYAQQHALRLVLERLVDDSARQLARVHAAQPTGQHACAAALAQHAEQQQFLIRYSNFKNLARSLLAVTSAATSTQVALGFHLHSLDIGEGQGVSSAAASDATHRPAAPRPASASQSHALQQQWSEHIHDGECSHARLKGARGFVSILRE